MGTGYKTYSTERYWTVSHLVQEVYLIVNDISKDVKAAKDSFKRIKGLSQWDLIAL